MLEYGVALLLHILVVAYVLGGDLGRYYLAGAGAAPAAAGAERVAAARGVVFIGSISNAALILILLAGAQVAAAVGAYRIIIPGWFTATWIVTGVWLLLAFVADWSASRGGWHWAGWLDLTVRAGMGLGNVYDAIIAVQGQSRSVDSFWLAAKIGVFGLLILTSIPVRRAGWAVRRELAALAASPGDAAAGARLGAALAAHRWPLLVTWGLVLVAAWLGVNKPG